MSERTRGPERSSGPAPTDQGSPSGSDDFYAAAAAAVRDSGRGRRVGSGGNDWSAGGSGGNGSGGGNGRSTSAAVGQDRDKLTPKAPPAPRSDQKAAASRTDSGAARNRSDGGDAEATTIGAVASQVLNAVKPKSKAQKAEERANNSGPAADLVRSEDSASPAAAEPTTVTATQTATTAAVPAKVAAAQPAKVAAAQPTRAEKPKAGVARGTRKARLRLSRLDPWSVMKTSFMFSIAAGIVFVVAVFAVWTVIGSSGLFGSVDSIVGSVLQSPGDTTPFRIEDYINTQKVMGVTAFLACIDVVIFTALATLASFLYNLAATMLGGLEVTLAED